MSAAELARVDAPADLARSTAWQIVVTAYLDAALDSPHTRRAYQRHLRAAFAGLDVPAVADLTGAQLATYRAQLTGSSLAPASQAQALAALRAFLAWSGTMGAHRIVPDQADVARAIRAYLAATGRHLGQEGPLFRAHDRAATKLPRGRLTTLAAGYVVARCTTAAGIDAKQISPHSLRHTFAIRSLRSRHDVIAVQKLLGHASVATTQRYLDHLDLAELRQAVPDLPVVKLRTPPPVQAEENNTSNL